MTPKSYITLCIAAISYIIMAAVAVVSPHGDFYAVPTSAQSEGATDVSSFAVQDEEPAPQLIFRNESGTEVNLDIDMLKTFAATPVTVDIDGTQHSFTAAHFNLLMEWSSIRAGSDMIVIKGGKNLITACRTVDLQKDGNSYLIYGDENGNPLDAEVYGNFCLYVAEGSKTGFFKDVNIIDFG